MKRKELKDETVLNKIVEIIKEARVTLLEDILKRQLHYANISFIIRIESIRIGKKRLLYSYEIYEEFLYMEHTTGRRELNDEEKIKSKIAKEIEQLENKYLGEQNVEFAIEFKTGYRHEKRHKELDLLLSQKAKNTETLEE